MQVTILNHIDPLFYRHKTQRVTNTETNLMRKMKANDLPEHGIPLSERHITKI